MDSCICPLQNSVDMAIIRSVWKTNINGSEFCVVKEDRNPEVLFSVVQNNDGVTTRITFRLSDSKSIDLAKFLANITTLDTKVLK